MPYNYSTMIKMLVVLNEEGRIRIVKEYERVYNNDLIIDKIKEVCKIKKIDLYQIDNDNYLVFKKYGSVLFVFLVDYCNFIFIYEKIHLFVEDMNNIFDGFSEFDLVFNFHKIDGLLNKHVSYMA
eukprot:GHVP01021359.1.p1 GENE.GHVP01021359.1~~GHVP01021359.1.p1  ORF type:complete len:125 (-),score=13.19 GHVP01021359.1:141-515(-)